MIALKFYHTTKFIKQSYCNQGSFWSDYNSPCYSRFNITTYCSHFDYYFTTDIGRTEW